MRVLRPIQEDKAENRDGTAGFVCCLKQWNLAELPSAPKTCFLSKTHWEDVGDQVTVEDLHPDEEALWLSKGNLGAGPQSHTTEIY